MGLPYAEPLAFLSLRFSIAAIILVVVQLFVAKSRRKSISLLEIFHSAIAGILLQAVYLGGVFSSIALGIGAGLSALIVGLQPLITVVLASCFLAWHYHRCCLSEAILLTNALAAFCNGAIHGKRRLFIAACPDD